jgi:hypothetical protein
MVGYLMDKDEIAQQWEEQSSQALLEYLHKLYDIESKYINRLEEDTQQLVKDSRKCLQAILDKREKDEGIYS